MRGFIGHLEGVVFYIVAAVTGFYCARQTCTPNQWLLLLLQTVSVCSIGAGNHLFQGHLLLGFWQNQLLEFFNCASVYIYHFSILIEKIGYLLMSVLRLSVRLVEMSSPLFIQCSDLQFGIELCLH